MHFFKFKMIFSLTLFIISSSVFPQSNHVSFNVRPLGMADAYVGVADDINALYWNPAGLAFQTDHAATFTHFKSLGGILRNTAAGYVYPAFENHVFGFSYYQLDLPDDGELDWGWNYVQLSYGARLFRNRSALENLSIGINIKYGRRTQSLDDIVESTPAGFSTDFALYYNYKNVKFGLLWQDLGGFVLEDQYTVNGSKRTDKFTLQSQQFNFGLAYSGWRDLLLAMSISANDRLHFGAERWFLKKSIGLRAGWQRDIYDSPEKQHLFSFGSSLSWSFLQFDYAYTTHPTFSGTNYFALNFSKFIRKIFGASKVKVRSFSIDPIFASRLADYLQQPIGKAVIENKGDENVDARLALVMQGFPEEKSVVFDTTISLPRNDPKIVRFTAKLPDQEMYAIRGDKRMRVQMKLSKIQSASSQFEKDVDKTMLTSVFSTGKLTWDEGPSAAVNFITPDDSVVQNFVDRVLEQYKNVLAAYNRPDKIIYKAALLFDALGQLDIAYKQDRNSVFHGHSTKIRAIDEITFPRLLLKAGPVRGDCDDLTVLLASVLQAAGIETAIALVPGHAYLYFNSRLHPKKTVDRPFDSLIYKSKEGRKTRLWLPVDAVKIGGPLIEAMRAGKRHERELVAGKFQPVNSVREAHKQFIPHIKVENAAIPSLQEINDYLEIDSAVLDACFIKKTEK